MPDDSGKDIRQLPMVSISSSSCSRGINPNDTRELKGISDIALAATDEGVSAEDFWSSGFWFSQAIFCMNGVRSCLPFSVSSASPRGVLALIRMLSFCVPVIRMVA